MEKDPAFQRSTPGIEDGGRGSRRGAATKQDTPAPKETPETPRRGCREAKKTPAPAPTPVRKEKPVPVANPAPPADNLVGKGGAVDKDSSGETADSLQIDTSAESIDVESESTSKRPSKSKDKNKKKTPAIQNSPVVPAKSESTKAPSTPIAQKSTSKSSVIFETPKKIPEAVAQEASEVGGEEGGSAERSRVSGRKRSMKKDVMEFLKGSKSKTQQKSEQKTEENQPKNDTSKITTSTPIRKSTKKVEEDEEMDVDVVDASAVVNGTVTESSESEEEEEVEVEEEEKEEEEVEAESESSEEEDTEEESTEFLYCKYCDWALKSAAELSKHKKGHHKNVKKGTNSLLCMSCRKPIARHDLKWHMHTLHNEDPNIVLQPSKKTYCLKCNFSTKSKKDLEVHLGGSHPELLQVECRLCDEKFSTKHFYTEHFKSAHGKSMDEETLECFLCNKTFKSLPKLHHHYSIVHMKKNQSISCTLCSKFFYEQEDLVKHQERFHKNDKFQCGLCLVEFEEASQCEEHVFVHKQKSGFRCKLCNFYFASQEVLDKHVTTHATQVLTCDVCEAEFKTLSEYKTHKRTHREADNMSDTSSLDSHSKQRVVNKTYNCSSCEKTFGSEEEIKAHMDKVHLGDTHAPVCTSEREETDEEGPADTEAADAEEGPTINHCKQCGQTFLRPEIFAEHQKQESCKPSSAATTASSDAKKPAKTKRKTRK